MKEVGYELTKLDIVAFVSSAGSCTDPKVTKLLVKHVPASTKVVTTRAVEVNDNWLRSGVQSITSLQIVNTCNTFCKNRTGWPNFGKDD